MPPTPIHLYKRDTAPPPPSPSTTSSGAPNVALIAGLVTCTTVILFLSLVVVIPMIRRRHQRKAPPPSTVEEFLGKDDTFNQTNPNDIAAILDHLSYLPQNDVSQVKIQQSAKRRSFLQRLSSQRPPSIIGSGSSRRYSGQNRLSYRNSGYYEKGDYESQYSVPADMPPPMDEYANYNRNSLTMPASAPAYSHRSTRPLNVNKGMQPSRRTQDVTSPESDYDYSEDSEDDYAYDRPVYRAHTAVPRGENRQSTVGELLRTRFNRDSTAHDSFSLAAAPKPKHRPPPLSKSSGAASPAATRSAVPLGSVPEMPNSSIAVGFSLPESHETSPNDNQSPEQYRHVPLTPRNVALPRTPGSPLKEVYTASAAPRTPLRDALTPRLPFTRRDVASPF